MTTCLWSVQHYLLHSVDNASPKEESICLARLAQNLARVVLGLF
jgi:hypothetical protein